MTATVIGPQPRPWIAWLLAGRCVSKAAQHSLEQSKDLASVREFACLYWLGANDSAGTVSRHSLDPYEVSRFDAYHFPEDRYRFLCGRLIVRSVLASILGCCSRDVPLRVDSGRPFLDPGADQNIHFSISHAADAVMVSFRRDVETGIDVERHRNFDNLNDVARRVMTDAEHNQFCGLTGADSVAAFYRLWTRKEAVLKLMGTGFSVPPDTVSTGFETEGESLASCQGIDYVVHDGSLEHAGQRYSWAHATRANRRPEMPLFHVQFITNQADSATLNKAESKLTLNIEP